MHNNPFKYSNSNLRYHTLSYYFKKKYKQKVFKVSLDAGFSCPNRDGTCAYGGCTFCSSEGSGEFAGDREDSLLTQYSEVKERMEKKWPGSKTVAYFQAYTNTHGPLSKIKKMVEPFLNMEEVVAIDIATRPDSLADDVIEYLDSLTSKKDIWIELGLQSIFDQTGKDFNRGYDFDVFVDTINRLRDTNIKVCVHLLNGLPNESAEMMIESARTIGLMPIDAVKIHMLHLLEDSKMGQDYLKAPFHLLTQDEYAEIVASQLEVLPPRVVIQRITGDAETSKLIGPQWTTKKFVTMNEIQKKLVERNSMQGTHYQAPTNINDINHQWIQKITQQDHIVVDATAGNGYDTKLLADSAFHVYSFDIQKEALKRTQERCNSLNNITYIHDSHAHLNDHIEENIDLIVYNLGYLPQGDKNIVTNPSSTLKSLAEAFELLKDHGHILITFYRNHPGGMQEYEACMPFILEHFEIIESYQYPYWFKSPVSYLLIKKHKK